MILKIFTVYDSKAEAYLPPFFSATRGLALRSFTDAVNTAGHAFNRYAEDYTLFEVGEFDDQHCTFEIHAVCQPLGRAIEFLKLDIPKANGDLFDDRIRRVREFESNLSAVEHSDRSKSDVKG